MSFSLSKLIDTNDSAKFDAFISAYMLNKSSVTVVEVDASTLRENKFTATINNTNLFNTSLDKIAAQLASALNQNSPNGYSYSIDYSEGNFKIATAFYLHAFYFPATTETHDINGLLSLPIQTSFDYTTEQTITPVLPSLFTGLHLQQAIKLNNSGIITTVRKYGNITMDRFHLGLAIDTKNTALIDEFLITIKPEKLHLTKAIGTNDTTIVNKLFDKAANLKVTFSQFQYAIDVASNDLVIQLIPRLESGMIIKQ